MPPLKDLTGHVYNNLYVNKHVGYDKNRNSLWLCTCSCGNQVTVRAFQLKHQQGCGHCVQHSMLGNKYGKLTVIAVLKSKATCKCDCGNVVTVNVEHLKTGHTKSCGCSQHIRRNLRSDLDKKLYRLYQDMKKRCYNPHNNRYKDYGGRGIKVCDLWLQHPNVFVQWCKENDYKQGLSIDRIDNNGDYSPDNCRFITMAEQSRNKRTNKHLFYNGENHLVGEWASITGINKHTIQSRLVYGWSIKDALTKPVRKGFCDD